MFRRGLFRQVQKLSFGCSSETLQIEILSRLVLRFLLQTENMNADIALIRHARTHIHKHNTQKREMASSSHKTLMLPDPLQLFLKPPFCKKKCRQFLSVSFLFSFLLFALYMWVNSVIDEQKEEICRLTKMGLHTTEKMKGAIGFGCALHSSNADCLAQCHTWMADARLALFYFGMTNPCPDHAETRPAASCGFLDCYLCAPLSLSHFCVCLLFYFLPLLQSSEKCCKQQ